MREYYAEEDRKVREYYGEEDRKVKECYAEEDRKVYRLYREQQDNLMRKERRVERLTISHILLQNRQIPIQRFKALFSI